MVELSFKVAAFLAGLIAPAAFVALKYFYRQFISLHGKVVVITGASSGIGKACAHEFFRNGCKVVLCARNDERLEQVRKELLSLEKCNNENQPLVVKMDISDKNSISSAVNKINESYPNGVHMLINNAGISYRGNILSTTMEVHRKMMETNYFGQVLLTNMLLPSMLKLPLENKSNTKAYIISINSIQGKISIPHRSAYAASKFACDAFFDCLRSEIAACGVRVCTVYPGYVKTHLSLNAVTDIGTNYGKMDSTTEAGLEPNYVACQIVHAVLQNQESVLLTNDCKQRFAIWIQFFFPSLFFWLMKKRAKS